jgi:hypothetical protein
MLDFTVVFTLAAAQTSCFPANKRKKEGGMLGVDCWREIAPYGVDEHRNVSTISDGSYCV